MSAAAPSGVREPAPGTPPGASPDRPRLCVDCRFACAPVPPVRPCWSCFHPSSRIAAEMNVVTGALTSARQIACELARAGITVGRCGYDARFWEPRT